MSTERVLMIMKGKTVRLTLTVADSFPGLNSQSVQFGMPVMVDMPFDLVVDTLCANLKDAAKAALGQQADAEGGAS